MQMMVQCHLVLTSLRIDSPRITTSPPYHLLRDQDLAGVKSSLGLNTATTERGVSEIRCEPLPPWQPDELTAPKK
jgi:hypothetical protein